MKIDRKKVIKSLETCSDVYYGATGACSSCSFSQSKNCFAELVHQTIELLKEQETVKPYIDIDEAKCPVCKVKLTRQELLGDDVLFEDFYDFCPRCGRRVVWGE